MSRHATTIGRTTDVARDGRAAAPASSRATSDASSSHAAPAPLVPDFFTRLASPVPQTKLTVSQPGDRLEREADAAADRVMGGSLRMSSPGTPDDAGTEAAADAVAHAPTGATTTAAEGDLQRHASQADGALRRHESQADDVLQRHASRADSAAERPASQANAALQPHASPAGRTKSDATVSNAPSVESRLASLRGTGAPLPDGLRDFYEQRFGRDFSSVRLHTDGSAADAARSLRARAFTYGSDLVFGAGEFAPGTDAGRHLIAHELAHVVQQGAAAPAQVMRKASYGVVGEGEKSKDGPTPSVTIAESDEAEVLDEAQQEETPEVQREALSATPDIQRDALAHAVAATPDIQLDALAQPVASTPDIQRDTLPGDAGTTTEAPVADVPAADGGAVPAQSAPSQPAQAPPQPAPPTLATPTLTVTPGATLVRGGALTATVGFTPAAGESMTISDWKYTTTDHGDLSRPTTDPTFQTSWAGTMALSGTIEVTYAITPAGGTAGADQTLSQAVTVSDRTGTSWTAQVVEAREAALAGKPSPPQVFSDLGLHESFTPGITPTATAITAGPNTGLSFVGSLTSGNFESKPSLHPQLRSATNAFKTFHSVPSRLYMVRNGTRTLVPGAAYSGLVTDPTLSFTVPDWEAFYKARGFYVITASFGGNDVVLQPAWWGLDSNAEDATIQIRNDAAIRAALSMTDPADSYTTSIDSAGWSGFRLMQAAAIVAGTQSHEYAHATHSHRANFRAMIRALDPPKLLEKSISSATTTVDFATRMTTLMDEIREPDHELVDEAASATAEEFVAGAGTMAGVNEDPATGAFLGSVWDITNDTQMS